MAVDAAPSAPPAAPAVPEKRDTVSYSGLAEWVGWRRRRSRRSCHAQSGGVVEELGLGGAMGSESVTRTQGATYVMVREGRHTFATRLVIAATVVSLLRLLSRAEA